MNRKRQIEFELSPEEKLLYSYSQDLTKEKLEEMKEKFQSMNIPEEYDKQVLEEPKEIEDEIMRDSIAKELIPSEFLMNRDEYFGDQNELKIQGALNMDPLSGPVKMESGGNIEGHQEEKDVTLMLAKKLVMIWLF